MTDKRNINVSLPLAEYVYTKDLATKADTWRDVVTRLLYFSFVHSPFEDTTFALLYLSVPCKNST